MSGTHRTLTADLIREPVEDFFAHSTESWPSWAFSNHDVVRVTSRWLDQGNGFDHNPTLSKTLIALLGCLYGTLFLYQGEELGLPEAKMELKDLQDPWGKHLWPEWQGRDGCRTPMPWTDKPPAKSWLPTPQTHLPLNIAAQNSDKNSTLNVTRDFLKWRASQPALKTGTIHFLDTGDDKLLAFERRAENAPHTTLLCLFNLGPNETSLPPLLDTPGETLYPPHQKAGALAGYTFEIRKI